MTDDEVMTELRSKSPLNMARQQFSAWSARIEQCGQQKKPLDPIQWRRMEFEAVKSIMAAFAKEEK